jgi:Tol biopolymer transport system component
MLDGQRQAGEFEEVKSLAFSGGGQHLAFAARRGKAWMMVLDGKEPAQTFEKLSEPLFSPDGQRLVHFGKRQGKWSVIVNGEPLGAPFDELEDAMFSPDGQRLAVVGRRGGKLIVTVDLKEGPPFDVIGGLSFSDDGRHVSYAGADIKTGFGGDKGLGRAVIDGEPGPQFEGEKSSSMLKAMATGPTSLVSGNFGDLSWRVHGVSAPVFSADGSRVAYVAHRDKDNEVVIADGQPGPQFAAIVTAPRFSPDAKRIGYAARRAKDDEVVVVDGQPGPRFASIVAGPRFCNEGRHVAYVASEAGGARFLIVDGERVGGALLQGADFVSSLTFAPDGKRVGCIGIAGSFWAGSGPRSLGGSGKGVGRSAKRRVYVDGQPGPEYDTQNVSGLEFTPDSRHVIYVVHGLQEGSRKVSFVVTNRTEARRYDAVWTRTLGVQDTGAVVYVAESGRKFLRVTHPIQ